MATPLNAFMEEVAEITGVRDPSDLVGAGNDNSATDELFDNGSGVEAEDCSGEDEDELEGEVSEVSEVSEVDEIDVESVSIAASDRPLTDEELATVDWDSLEDKRPEGDSSLIDIRGLANLYHERRGLAPAVRAEEDDWPLVDGTVDRERHILLPAANTQEPRKVGLWVAVGAGFWLASIALTAAVTAYVVSRPAAGPAEQAAAPAAEAAVAVADTQSQETASPAGVFSDVRPTLAAEEETTTVTDEVVDEVEAPEATARVADEASRETAAASETVRTSTKQPEPVAEKVETTPVVEAPEVVEEPAPVVEEPKPEPVAAAGGQACDEVLCLLEGKGCCGTKPETDSSSTSEASEVDSNLPTSLGRSEMNAGLKSVSGRLSSCGTQHGVSGAVSVKFKIAASGAVKSATVKSGSDAFQSCMVGVLKKAHFAETQKGVSMNFPIVLR